jgi:hypothetical protein
MGDEDTQTSSRVQIAVAAGQSPDFAPQQTEKRLSFVIFEESSLSWHPPSSLNAQQVPW